MEKLPPADDGLERLGAAFQAELERLTQAQLDSLEVYGLLVGEIPAAIVATLDELLDACAALEEWRP